MYNTRKMKIHRFFYSVEITKDTQALTITDEALLHQIYRVLKLSKGETIELVTGNSTDIRGKIETMTKNMLILEELEILLNSKDPIHTTHLCLSILKRENFELAVAKAVECGVTEITPILSARTIKAGYNRERIERIIKESVEQSGRNKLPTLHSACTLTEALEKNKEYMQYLCHFGGTNILTQKNNAHKKYCIYIGPEGGFTEEEVRLAETKQIPILSLGDRILRAETAAIIATYQFANSY